MPPPRMDDATLAAIRARDLFAFARAWLASADENYFAETDRRLNLIVERVLTDLPDLKGDAVARHLIKVRALLPRQEVC